MVTQSTPGIGDWKAEAIALLQSLPTELPDGFKENSAWFHARLRELLRVNPSSETARQLEAVLAGTAQVQHIEKALGMKAPKGQPGSIEEQVKLFLQVFPDLDVSRVEENIAKATALLKPGASLFCYVRTSKMAKHFSIKNPWGNFGELTEKTLGLLVARRKFRNFREGQHDPSHYRLLASTKKAMQRIEAQQKGDIIILPAQLGELYRGKSVDTSRELIKKSGNQFCLPAFIVGQILLVNPDILTSNGDLFIDCPGDEYLFDAQGPFGHSLCFFVARDGVLCFHGGWAAGPDGRFGSAWGFVQ